MSVASILAFVIAGAAAFKGKRDRAEESPKRTRYAELIFDNADLRKRVAELEADVARANVQARRDQELIDIWRARAFEADEAHTQLLVRQVPAGPDRPPADFGAPAPRFALQQAAAQMQSQQMLAQYLNQAAAQQAQGLAGLAQQQGYQAQAGLGQAFGLLGAQSLIDAELFCNCVPSRAQVWAANPE